MGDNNEEGGGVRRWLMVSLREEGRVLGVVRGVSMRWRNLWDGVFFVFLLKIVFIYLK